MDKHHLVQGVKFSESWGSKKEELYDSVRIQFYEKFHFSRIPLVDLSSKMFCENSKTDEKRMKNQQRVVIKIGEIFIQLLLLA